MVGLGVSRSSVGLRVGGILGITARDAPKIPKVPPQEPEFEQPCSKLYTEQPELEENEEEGTEYVIWAQRPQELSLEAT